MAEILPWLPIIPMVSGALWFTYQLAVKPMAEKVKAHSEYHQKHFGTASKQAQSIAVAKQELKDHDYRFQRLEALCAEIRGDVKELLRRPKS